MVSYQAWTSILFDVVKTSGVEMSRETASDTVSVGAEIWQDRKADLQSATRQEARRIAGEEINVR